MDIKGNILPTNPIYGHQENPIRKGNKTEREGGGEIKKPLNWSRE